MDCDGGTRWQSEHLRSERGDLGAGVVCGKDGINGRRGGESRNRCGRSVDLATVDEDLSITRDQWQLALAGDGEFDTGCSCSVHEIGGTIGLGRENDEHPWRHCRSVSQCVGSAGRLGADG